METLQSDTLLVGRMHNPGWQVVPPLLAPCPVRRVAALAFLLLSLVAVAPAQANCSLVQIEAVAPLDFGLLRVEKKRSGWALVEPAGARPCRRRCRHRLNARHSPASCALPRRPEVG